MTAAAVVAFEAVVAGATVAAVAAVVSYSCAQQTELVYL